MLRMSTVGYGLPSECLMDNQVLSQLNFSLLKSKFTGACGSIDQLQTASTAATEARVPDPSAVLGLQYLKNSVTGQRRGGDVLT